MTTLNPEVNPEVYPPPDKRKRPDLILTDSTATQRKWTGTLPDKFIAAIVSLISQSNLQNWVQTLSAFPTRHTKSPTIHQVSAWLVNQFKSFGYTDVVLHPYTKAGYQLENVVCTKQGKGNTGQVLVLCGHYDCCMEEPNNATATAPGADDNATGIAVILEIARILAQVDLEDSVQLVSFSGEEQGLWGSTAYAQHVQANNINVHRLINLDMVGYPSTDSAIIVERDMGGVASNNQASQDFGKVMEQMALDYTSMPVKLGPIYSSDYMPFEARGYVVIGAYEAGENPHYHTSTDAPNTVNYSYVADVARMTMATVLHETAAVMDESTSPIDVYIRDNPNDTGSQPSDYPHWTSPDIWVRNNPPPDPNNPHDPNSNENPDAGHQAPINNVPNYLYVRVHNRGSQAISANAFSVKAFHCNPATAMLWPTHFHLMGELTITQTISANSEARVGPFIWTPQIKDHECLLAIVSGLGDHAITDIYNGQIDHGVLVRYDNNVGQVNVKPASSVPGGKTKTSFMVRGTVYPSTNCLTVDATTLPPDTHIEVHVARRLTEGATGLSGFTLSDQNTRWSTLVLSGSRVGMIENFLLDTNDESSVTLTIDFSYKAEHLHRYPIVITQECEGLVVGRLTIEITAVKETDDFVYGNPLSMELHTVYCPLWSRIAQHHKVPFLTVKDALIRGYNGCAFCLPEYNTG